MVWLRCLPRGVLMVLVPLGDDNLISMACYIVCFRLSEPASLRKSAVRPQQNYEGAEWVKFFNFSAPVDTWSVVRTLLFGGTKKLERKYHYATVHAVDVAGHIMSPKTLNIKIARTPIGTLQSALFNNKYHLRNRHQSRVACGIPCLGTDKECTDRSD